VLLFGTEFPPSAAGTAIYARSLALGLSAQGVDVHVLTMAPDATSPEDADQPFRVTRLPPTGNVARRYARCLGALRRDLQRLQPDCLWTTNGMGTRVAGLLSQVSCPLITCARGSDIRTRLPGRGPWRRLESLPLRRAYRRSAAVAAACQDLHRLAVDRGIDGARIFVSHSAFDFARLETLRASRPCCSREARALLTVARLTRQKRVDVLLQAVAIAVERLPELRYTIVGDGPERGRLERRARDLGIAARVRFAGQLPPFSSELCAEYERAAVFGLASVGEGLANVFIEAGAFGLPSLGVDSGGTPEVVRHGDTGWLVPADDPQAAADRLVDMMSDDEALERMGSSARDWILEEFGLDTLGRRSAAVVRSVIAGSGPGAASEA
jgi:phosphatidylinositol alpha-1,6-mannosyltransferase